MTAGPTPSPPYRFVQLEFPWALGPSDGRYLVRSDGEPDAAPTHVIVFATLGAPERRRLSPGRLSPGLSPRRRSRPAETQPPPTPVVTGRATIIEVARPLRGGDEAAAWLRTAGEPELEEALVTLNRALHAFRLVCADPDVHTVGRRQAIVSRIGYGAGEQVADGLWADARELIAHPARQRRARILTPQARLAAVLGARQPALACEELTLRARLDLDHGRSRVAALQLLVALDAALAELSADPRAEALADRLSELHGRREAVAGAAQSALTGSLGAGELETITVTVSRLESALRAWSTAGA